MTKRISPSGRVYSPFTEYFYSILLIILSGQVLSSCILFGIFYLISLPPYGSFLWYTTAAFNLLSFLMVVGVFIHFIRIKNWLVVGAMITLFFTGMVRAELFNTATYFTFDFGPVILVDKIIFWITIGFALTFIYSDRNRYSWLLYYGLTLAVSEVLRLLFWDSPGIFLNILNSLLLISADLIMGLYLWHFWEKKTPFWFLIPVKRRTKIKRLHIRIEKSK